MTFDSEDKVQRFIPEFKVESFVSILSEITDYNHRLMNVPQMWKSTRGKGVKIAVLDTGWPVHNDIKLAGTGSMISGYGADKQGHSTHCAGIIGAIADNGMGCKGIAPESELYACAVLDGNGTGSARAIANGVRWAVDAVHADIISMSLGMPARPTSFELKSACEYAKSKGVVILAAAGNEAGSVGQPGCYDSTIAVAAVDEAQKHASFSNFGPQVDFAAGGVNVYSTYLNNGYAKLSGTCLQAGTLIYTPTGPIPIEHVAVGTEVYAFKDNKLVTRHVTANLYQGKNKVYRLKARGRSLWATESHKILVVDTKAKQLDWVALNQLTKDHRLPIPSKLETNSGVKATISGAAGLLAKLGLTGFGLAVPAVDMNTTHETDVYDLTVPDADCFVANGIIVHNSMATPAVAGIIALIMSDALQGPNPRKLTPDEVKAKLKKIAYDVGPNGWDSQFGWGIPVFGHQSNTSVDAQPDVAKKETCFARYLAKLASKANPALADRLAMLGKDLTDAAELLRK